MSRKAEIEKAIAELALSVPLKVRCHGAARRMVLRVGHTGQAGLTVPPGASIALVRQFLDERRDWLQAHHAALPPPVPFESGARVPVEGVERLVRWDPNHRGGFALGGDTITVGGDPRHTARRVRDGLISLSRRRLSEQVVPLAQRLEQRVTAITVRDTRSRWGSCAANGRLSFSWRLILAPPEILRYVGVHEVAHLRHHHHGPAFWALVRRLMPDYRSAEAWLKHHGPALHRFGVEASSMADMQ